MSGLRQTLLMILLITGLNVSLAQETQLGNELSQELVSSRIQALRDTGSQEGAETTVGSYEAVLNWLGEATVHAASEKTYLQAQIDAPQQEAEIRDRMASTDYRSPDINPDAVSKLSKKELDEKLATLRLKLRDSQTAKSQLDEKLASEQSSSPIIQTRLEAIDKRLQELPSSPVTIEPDLQPSQFEATQWAVLAERKALNAERRSLEARLASQPVRYSRRKAQSDEFVLILSGLNFEIKSLEAELATRAEAQESKPVLSIDEEAPGYGFIRQLVEGNTRLREERADLDKIMAQLNEENNQLENQLSSLNNRFEGVKRLVSQAENSPSLGHVLMVHWHQTDSFRLSDVISVTSGTIGDHVIQRTHYEDILNSISDSAGFITDGFSAEIGDPEVKPDEKLITTAQELLRSKRELLTGLIASETELVNKNGSFDRNRNSLSEQFELYQAYLGSRILWVPSHPPLSLEILRNIRNDINAFTLKLGELSFSKLEPLGMAGLVLALVLLGLRKKIDSKLNSINSKVGRVREDSIIVTLRALVLNFVRLSPFPLVLLLLTNSLQSPDSDIAPYLASGLQDSISVLLVLLLVRTSCLDIGIARTHFGWKDELCDNLKRVSTRLLIWWFPFVVLTALIFKVEVDSINAVLGRLLFCFDNLILTLLLFSFLTSDSLKPKKYTRSRFWALLVIFANGAFFITYAILGYLYSSQVIFAIVTNSLIIIIASAFFFFIMQRWLLVYRRRLRFNELLAARQLQREGEAREVETETIDLVSLSDSVTSLLKVASITLAAFSLVFIWTPLFRALEVMQRITLWTVNDMLEGEAILTSITLASLVQAILIGVFTIVAARNVPPLFSLVLRGRKSISQGSRYAVVKLLGYLIITVGILAFLTTLGLRWDRLQWLVAALGVGIGFGLQEIIANFISGLIILFERPVRVGDVVTVGDCSGEVIRIRIRATTIRDFDGKELLVPNKEFVTGRLLNWTLSDTSIRMTLDVGIAYGSDVRKAVSILESILRDHELIAKDPEPDVIFSKFDDSALNLTARYFFTDVQQRGLLLSDLHMKINDGFKEAGIVIAFPQIDVHFDRENKADIPGEVATT